MMTQTHCMVGAALLGKPTDMPRNLVAVAGGIVPDAAIFVLYAVEKTKGTPESKIWSDVYFSPFWQDAVAWGNSMPLWLMLFVTFALLKQKWLGQWLGERLGKRLGELMMVFALSCLIHVAMDFPVHVEDAHRHFFPLSDYRFRSPVSYWDPRHFGVPMMIGGACLGIVLSILLFRRHANWAARGLIGLMLLGYLAVPVYFLSKCY